MTRQKQHSIQKQLRLHRESGFDKVLRWLDSLPISIWFVYICILILLVGFFNALAWIVGSLPFGTFDLYRSSIPFYPIGSMMFITYLNRVALQAFATFRSAIDISDEQYANLEHRLITMPRHAVRVTLLVSLPVSTLYILNTPYLLILVKQSHVIGIIKGLFYLFAFALMMVYFYHSVWQLWMITRLHRVISRIDLFNRAPLYAFSRLSSRTGMSLLLMSYFGIITDPATFSNVALVYVTAIAVILAIISFFLPLQGIYRCIVAEKKRLVEETNMQLSIVIREVFSEEKQQSMGDVVERTHLLHSFVATRDVIERIPTLPWEMSTLVGFLSAVAAPAIAGLIVFFASNWI